MSHVNKFFKFGIFGSYYKTQFCYYIIKYAIHYEIITALRLDFDS